MCQAFLPLMPAGKGQGKKNYKFQLLNGPDRASPLKRYVRFEFAVEGLSECLSLEIGGYNIQVVFGTHGPPVRFPVSIAARFAIRPPLTPLLRRLFEGDAKIASARSTEAVPRWPGCPPGIIRKKRPRLRYTVGRFDQRLAVFLKKVLPGRVFERIMRAYYLGGR